MKFLCAVYVDEVKMAGLSSLEAQDLDNASLEHDAMLRRAGHLYAAQALDRASRSATVQVRGGKVSVTDGPFAETKELLGGFLLIEAHDLDEAIEFAAQVPVAKYGTIEVRPVKELVASKSSVSS
jgi:hypothetical protein